MELIEAFADTHSYWVSRFTEDVVPFLNKGWRLTGVDNNIPCSNCYVYSGTSSECYQHDEIRPVSFNEIKKVSPCMERFDTYNEWYVREYLEMLKEEDELKRIYDQFGDPIDFYDEYMDDMMYSGIWDLLY